MNMSERAPPNRICPVSSGQSSVRLAIAQTMAAVTRGIRGSNGIAGVGGTPYRAFELGLFLAEVGSVLRVVLMQCNLWFYELARSAEVGSRPRNATS